ncbi:MAG: hypothetical protein UGF45_13255 [Massilioclostridium sp.]|nr:hypothetical protein [Massilioclostridium sp.]MEE1492933.1 hypothetical protein [Massilioclostridium sp.]
MVLAIDPGNIQSAYVLVETGTLRPVKFGKIKNEDLLELCYSFNCENVGHIAIEMVACYGMAVGKSVFDTCVWIGRFTEALSSLNIPVQYIFRKDEKMNICGTMKAKDSNIIQALIDRFAPITPNRGKGTKKEPGFFYGFHADIWQAYAVAVTYYDMFLSQNSVKYHKEGD